MIWNRKRRELEDSQSCKDEKWEVYNVSLQHVWMVVASMSLITISEQGEESRAKFKQCLMNLNRQLSPSNLSLSGGPGCDSIFSRLHRLYIVLSTDTLLLYHSLVDVSSNQSAGILKSNT